MLTYCFKCRHCRGDIILIPEIPYLLNLLLTYKTWDPLEETMHIVVAEAKKEKKRTVKYVDGEVRLNWKLFRDEIYK